MISSHQQVDSAFCHFSAFFEGKSPPISGFRILSQLFADRHLAFLTCRFLPFCPFFRTSHTGKRNWLRLTPLEQYQAILHCSSDYQVTVRTSLTERYLLDYISANFGQIFYAHCSLSTIVWPQAWRFTEDENRSSASWPSKIVRSGLLARIILSEVDILRGVR